MSDNLIKELAKQAAARDPREAVVVPGGVASGEQEPAYLLNERGGPQVISRGETGPVEDAQLWGRDEVSEKYPDLEELNRVQHWLRRHPRARQALMVGGVAGGVSLIGNLLIPALRGEF